MSEQKHTPDMYIVMLRDASGQIAAAFPERNPEQLSDHRVGHEPASKVIMVPAETAASAPDLLAACEAMLENADKVLAGLPVNHEAAQWIIGLRVQARAAIAKAGGAA